MLPKIAIAAYLFGVLLGLRECRAQSTTQPGTDNESTAATAPSETIRLFNGRDLAGFTHWLQESGPNDPLSNYRVTHGMLHLTGQGMGYLGTTASYRDYHLSLEYRWGERTDGSPYVRNSGILLHANGPAGNARGIWMASIECQLAQGCEGDIIVIGGVDAQGAKIPVTVSSDTRLDTDGRTRWQPGGTKTVYAGKQFWWSQHEAGFQELRDTRGQRDLASPLGEWTRVDCICAGDRIGIQINGILVNHCYDVYPSSGRILLENEKNEIYFRNLELRPLSSDDRRILKLGTTDD